MPYLLTILKAIVQGGKIVASLINPQVFDGARPRSYLEVGANIEVLKKIAARADGEYETPIRVAAGSAIFIDPERLWWPMENHLRDIKENFYQDYGPFGRLALLSQFRDGYAPGTSWCGDIAIGPLTHSESVISHALKETAEFGFYNPTGWLRFLLPKTFANSSRQRELQATLLDAQIRRWQSIESDLQPLAGGHAVLDYFRPDGIKMDKIDGNSAVISIEAHTGSIEVIYPLFLNLPPGQWLVKYCDKNLAGGKQIPLEHKERIIFSRPNQLPLMTAWGPNGLWPDHEVIEMAGTNITGKKPLINRKVLDVLQTLKWV